MRIQTVALVIGIPAVVAMLFFLLRDQPEQAQRAAPPQQESELSHIRAELSRLERSVDASQKTALEAVRAATQAADKRTNPVPTTAAEQTPPAQEQRSGTKEDDPRDSSSPAAPPADYTAQQLNEHLEDNFYREEVDQRWSREATTLAERRLETSLPESSALRSLECRQTMCRIETSHRDLGSYQQFVQSAFLSEDTGLWNGGFMAAVLNDLDDGELYTVAYIAREGQSLPHPENIQAQNP